MRQNLASMAVQRLIWCIAWILTCGGASYALPSSTSQSGGGAAGGVPKARLGFSLDMPMIDPYNPHALDDLKDSSNHNIYRFPGTSTSLPSISQRLPASANSAPQNISPQTTSIAGAGVYGSSYMPSNGGTAGAYSATSSSMNTGQLSAMPLQSGDGPYTPSSGNLAVNTIAPNATGSGWSPPSVSAYTNSGYQPYAAIATGSQNYPATQGEGYIQSNYGQSGYGFGASAPGIVPATTPMMMGSGPLGISSAPFNAFPQYGAGNPIAMASPVMNSDPSLMTQATSVPNVMPPQANVATGMMIPAPNDVGQNLTMPINQTTQDPSMMQNGMAMQGFPQNNPQALVPQSIGSMQPSPLDGSGLPQNSSIPLPAPNDVGQNLTMPINQPTPDPSMVQNGMAMQGLPQNNPQYIPPLTGVSSQAVAQGAVPMAVSSGIASAKMGSVINPGTLPPINQPQFITVPQNAMQPAAQGNNNDDSDDDDDDEEASPESSSVANAVAPTTATPVVAASAPSPVSVVQSVPSFVTPQAITNANVASTLPVVGGGAPTSLTVVPNQLQAPAAVAAVAQNPQQIAEPLTVQNVGGVMSEAQAPASTPQSASVVVSTEPAQASPPSSQEGVQTITLANGQTVTIPLAQTVPVSQAPASTPQSASVVVSTEPAQASPPSSQEGVQTITLPNGQTVTIPLAQTVLVPQEQPNASTPGGAVPTNQALTSTMPSQEGISPQGASLTASPSVNAVPAALATQPNASPSMEDGDDDSGNDTADDSQKTEKNDKHAQHKMHQADSRNNPNDDSDDDPDRHPDDYWDDDALSDQGDEAGDTSTSSDDDVGNRRWSGDETYEPGANPDDDTDTFAINSDDE